MCWPPGLLNGTAAVILQVTQQALEIAEAGQVEGLDVAEATVPPQNYTCDLMDTVRTLFCLELRRQPAIITRSSEPFS